MRIVIEVTGDLDEADVLDRVAAFVDEAKSYGVVIAGEAIGVDERRDFTPPTPEPTEP